ncbi:hypothetical protein K435DRAFT_793118 [Dendrothele bispora CBS 962.96]|uniref:WD40 repeat-like protein n=1 Tax=Dendrothele bispora (strain CBS 962.96) TaxID=1314807 RepID=A0A4V4HH73_DENBC|nr:hypothetical protein K435DRAFT_793118 [Dendrothele bispora CBS 962.96]
MPSTVPLIWKPSATSTTDGDPSSDGVTAMQFSADGRFLAVGSGCSVEIWDIRENTTNSFHVGAASTGIRCLQWFRHCYAIVTGHEGGGMYHTFLSSAGPCLSGFCAEGHHYPIKAISLWEDTFLAAATNRSVQIWELLNNKTWALRGILPESPTIGVPTSSLEEVSQSIYWFSGQEFLVSYEGISVVYSWADTRTPQLTQLPACFIPRSHQLNRSRHLPVSKAVFCMEDTVIGGSSGKCFLWDLSGRRLADLICPEFGDKTISSVASAYDYSFAIPRLATATDCRRNSQIILWDTVEDTTDGSGEIAVDGGARPASNARDFLSREGFYGIVVAIPIIIYAIFTLL